MKILALSDQECPWLWDYLDRHRLGEIDLILSCGDLKPQYLSFIVTFARAPLLYVHGNHDDGVAVIVVAVHVRCIAIWAAIRT